jgi:hypothetical protein
MFGQKPRDYHNWDRDTQRAYDKKTQEAEDLEYNLQRQRDDAERAENDARRAARRHSAEMEEANYQLEDLHAENNSLRNFLKSKGLLEEWKAWNKC